MFLSECKDFCYLHKYSINFFNQSFKLRKAFLEEISLLDFIIDKII